MFVFVAAIFLGQAALVSSSQPPIWPFPTKVVLADTSALVVDQSFKFTASANYGSVVENAMARYLALIAPPTGSQGDLKSCNIVVANNGTSEIIGANESYDLTVDNGACTISAQTTWGALRGLESFTHFLVRNADAGSVQTVSSSINVNDAPRFGHRGMLIDTARHYLSVDTIQKVIDAMPVSK